MARAPSSPTGFDIPQNPSSPAPPRRYKYTIADILSKTVGKTPMETARFVHYLNSKYAYDRRGRITLQCQTVTRDDEGSRRHYPQWYSQDPHYSGRLWNCKAICCSCDCKYFLYFLEYALWKKGLAEIRYSNGAFPEVTNPSLRVYACKHLLISGLQIISKKY